LSGPIGTVLELLTGVHPLPELAAALRRNAVAVPTHLWSSP